MVDSRTISEDIALEYATNPSDLKLKLEGVGRGGARKVIQEIEEDDMEAFDFKND